MTTEHKIGQMLLFGWSGATPEENQGIGPHAAALLDDMQVGGVILMGRNISPPESLRRMTGELQERAQGLGLPSLFVAVDQEGGRVNRLGPPHYTNQPPPAQIGATRDPARAR